MSWGYNFIGKLPAVRTKVQALNQTFTVSGEQEIYDAAKIMVLAALDCVDDTKVVKVDASGSAYAGDTVAPPRFAKGGNATVQVAEISGFLVE
jgi:hypothetical protein